MYDAFVKNIQHVQEYGESYYERTFHTFGEARRIATQRVDLKREIAFLERRDLDFSTLFTAPPTPPGQKKKNEPRSFNEREEDVSYAKQKRQYRRYFEEATERENVMLAKAMMVGARLESDVANMQMDIAKLEIRKKQLLKMHGVKDTSEIPGLIPQRQQRSDRPILFRADHN